MNPVLQILFLVAAVNGHASSLVARDSADVTKREDKVETLRNSIKIFLQDIQEGMLAATMSQAADNIRKSADEIISEKGIVVKEGEVLDIVKEEGAEFLGAVAPKDSQERLDFEKKVLGNSVQVLLNLQDRLTQEIENRKSIDGTLAAIGFTAGRISEAVDNTVSTVAEIDGSDPEVIAKAFFIRIRIEILIEKGKVKVVITVTF